MHAEQCERNQWERNELLYSINDTKYVIQFAVSIYDG